jgi:hypothetical protein
MILSQQPICCSVRDPEVSTAFIKPGKPGISSHPDRGLVLLARDTPIEIREVMCLISRAILVHQVQIRMAGNLSSEELDNFVRTSQVIG